MKNDFLENKIGKIFRPKSFNLNFRYRKKNLKEFETKNVLMMFVGYEYTGFEQDYKIKFLVNNKILEGVFDINSFDYLEEIK